MLWAEIAQAAEFQGFWHAPDIAGFEALQNRLRVVKWLLKLS